MIREENYIRSELQHGHHGLRIVGYFHCNDCGAEIEVDHVNQHSGLCEDCQQKRVHERQKAKEKEREERALKKFRECYKDLLKLRWKGLDTISVNGEKYISEKSLKVLLKEGGEE